MKILVLAPHYPISENKAIGTWAHNQARALERIGCDIDVICPSPYVPHLGLDLPDNIERWAVLPAKRVMDEVTVYYPKTPVLKTGLSNRVLWDRFPSSQNIATWASVKRTVSNLTTANSYDGILCHNVIPAAYIGQKIRASTGAPMTLMLHSYFDLNRAKREPRRRTIFENAITTADTAVTVSKKMVNKVNEIAVREYQIIYNGYDPEEVRNAENEEKTSNLVSGKTITCVGGLTPRKGQDILIEAWDLLQKRIDMAEKSLVIVGDGNCAEKIENMIHDKDLQDSITLVKNLTRKELNLLFRDSYAFVLPSWDEPFGVVYTEVMPYGTPIVATRGEGFSELITDRENGCLVESKDPQDLSDTLEFMCTVLRWIDTGKQ